jgi:hypothetical protein
MLYRKCQKANDMLLSAFTTFGALVGLITGVFTFWDRLAKGRPIAYLTFNGEGDHVSPRLLINNQLGLADRRIRFSISWRRGSTTWLWQMPINVRTRTSTIRKIAKKL